MTTVQAARQRLQLLRDELEMLDQMLEAVEKAEIAGGEALPPVEGARLLLRLDRAVDTLAALADRVDRAAGRRIEFPAPTANAQTGRR